MAKHLKYIQKAILMEIIKPEIQVAINKTELNNLIIEALADPESSAAIKRAIAPLLANSFPQFPEFTKITLGETTEEGTTLVTLRMPRQTTVTKSENINTEPEPEAISQAYVEPSDEEPNTPSDTNVTDD